MIKRIREALRKPIRLPTVSKRIVVALVILWFIGAIYGMIYCLVELILSAFVDSYTVHFGDLLAYIGGPVSGFLIGYLAKSAFETKESMKHKFIENYDTVVLGDGEGMNGPYSE